MTKPKAATPSTWCCSQPFINQPPTADAGGPYVVDEGTPLLLDASGSSDPNQAAESLIYEWDLSYDGRNFVAAVGGTEDPADDRQQYGQSVGLRGASDRRPRSVRHRGDDRHGQQAWLPESSAAFRDPAAGVHLDSDYLATLSRQFEDPGSDTHTVSIDWGDGSAVTSFGSDAWGERVLGDASLCGSRRNGQLRAHCDGDRPRRRGGIGVATGGDSRTAGRATWTEVR